MSRLQARISNAVGVFKKAQAKLEAVIEDASRQVLKIDDQIAELNVDKEDANMAMKQAMSIKSKILDIVGDDA